MDFAWEEYLELAEELVTRRGDPAAERSAISRAYYACFHRAASYWRDRGERLSLTGDDHILVWDLFLRPGADRASRWIGDTGHRLRRARRRADYDAALVATLSAEAQNWVRVARRLFSELSA
jgi:hypothetical protein